VNGGSEISMCCCNNKKLVVFGSGRTGTAAAYACGMLDNFKEIMIIDTNKSKAIGKAIDIQQGLILQNKDTLVNGTDDVKQIKGADVIIITASVPHAAKPGLDVREVLLHGNRPLITKLATDIFGVVPAGTKQPLIIILTNPMDLILSQFIKTAKKVTNNKVDLKKVVGSGN
jgi:malate dehydrogenase